MRRQQRRRVRSDCDETQSLDGVIASNRRRAAAVPAFSDAVELLNSAPWNTACPSRLRRCAAMSRQLSADNLIDRRRNCWRFDHAGGDTLFSTQTILRRHRLLIMTAYKPP